MLKRAFFLLAAGLMCISVQAYGQTTYRIQPGSKLWIDGTSNKSDWTVHATEIAGQVTMAQNGSAVQQVQVTIPSAKVLSQKTAIMDMLIHDALKVEEHPEIKYVLASAAQAAPSTNTGTFALNTQGRLTLGGVTKPVQMKVTGEKLANGQVRFKGSHELVLTDYGLEPPTAMYGALKTGDKVTIHFDVVAAPAALP